MHAFCLISAAGTSKSRVRAPQEMDKPPILKTRRSNAVQTRRLALHVSLLERHLAAMETERLRAVRQLHEELSQLQVPRRLPVMSPRHAMIMANSYSKVCQQQRKKLPNLTIAVSESVQEDKADKLNSAQQFCAKQNVLPPVSGNSTSSLKQPDTDRVQELEEKNTINLEEAIASSGIQSETKHIPTSLTLKSTRDRKAGINLRKRSSGSVTVPFAMYLPMKRGAIPRVSESVPPFGMNPLNNESQDQSENVLAGSKSKELRMHDGTNEDKVLQKDQQTEETEIPAKSDNSRTIEPFAAKPVHSQESPRDVEGQTHVTTQTIENSFPAESMSTIPLSYKDLRHSGLSSSTTSKSITMTKNHKSCHMVATAGYNCEYFPCMKPSTYHSLGFHPDPSTHTWRGWLVQNSRRPHHRLVPGRQALADLEGRRTPADDPHYMKRKKLGKEEVVRMDMAHKKYLHALARPPSWNTNYGEPTPYKRLMYPAKLKPLP